MIGLYADNLDILEAYISLDDLSQIKKPLKGAGRLVISQTVPKGDSSMSMGERHKGRTGSVLPPSSILKRQRAIMGAIGYQKKLLLAGIPPRAIKDFTLNKWPPGMTGIGASVLGTVKKGTPVKILSKADKFGYVKMSVSKIVAPEIGAGEGQAIKTSILSKEEPKVSKAGFLKTPIAMYLLFGTAAFLLGKWMKVF